MTFKHTTTQVLTQRFRDVMAQIPAAVAVVTTDAGDGPHGTTVSSFMSLSIDPPTMLISLDNDSSLLAKLQRGVTVGVNALTVDQGVLASRFAGQRKDDAPVEWEHSDGTPPRLAAAHAWLALTVTELIVVGDHTLVIGAVDAAHATADAPLIYWQRTYGTHTAT
ncbi:flavin reductase family protein [Janibacter cremeus]|uniref:Flavin reductase (DIM6/NTAB) family NADH-FMN oxidoreductase RutF n=1 Tax=Janibacter cremeus TaxID=1285192 RepID=A0A852VLR9_9MICO|nr:flavin reductase family protein [Janibacter cremeus]NYF97972.1 flavin reductase (DIM6/NTAB) family NADH-FMN oxidoreductase RutF [Janibacter cremeus]